MSLTIIGCTVIDIIFPEVQRLPSWPKHTEYVRRNLVFVRRPPIVTIGGNGASAAYVAARDGATVALVSNGGDDDFGRLARGWLESAGCLVGPAPFRTRTAVNVTAANSRHERATFFFPATTPSVSARWPQLENIRYLLVCGCPHPALSDIGRVFRRSKEKDCFNAIDVGPILGQPWSLEAMRAVLSKLDLLLGNEFELQQITRTKSLAQALQRLRRVYPGHVVIKRGAEGAMWLPSGAGRARIVRPRKIIAVNTVGAGDSFNGALLGALSRGAGMSDALARAIKVSAGVVASPAGVLGVASRNPSRRA